MTREIIATLMLSLVPLFGLMAFLAVKKKRSNQEKLLNQPSSAFKTGGFECIYVATVFKESPLDRIWAWGLGSRGEANISFSEGEISISRQGELGFSFQLSDFSLARATIDKGVETNGLVSLHWLNNGQKLITQIRFRSSKNQREFLSLLGSKDR